jgi:uncharacterized protein (TIGR02996 family)
VTVECRVKQDRDTKKWSFEATAIYGGAHATFVASDEIYETRSKVTEDRLVACRGLVPSEGTISMSLSDDHKGFLSAIVENPQDEAALLIYADWLDEHGDARSTYLRNQCEFRKSRTEELRRRLIQRYPHEHLAWTATLEQAGAVEANLTNFEFAWWGTGIGPARESNATYERFQYHDQPPLPVETFDGTFAWLRESQPRSSYSVGPMWRTYCAETRKQGYFVPEEFERLLSDKDLPARIKSCTDNYFLRPPDPTAEHSTPSAEWEDGLFVTFYADSQYCVLWGILLPREPGRYAPVLAGPPEALFPGIWGDAEDQSHIFGKPVLAASQFEQFLFRWWIENEIWYATVRQESRRPLTPVEQAYIDHLKRRYSDRR